MRILQIAVFCAASSACTGCLAAALAPTIAMVGGSAVRSGAKKVAVVLAPGVTAEILRKRKSIGIRVNGVNSATGQYVVPYGGGSTNASVYSDMLSQEFLKMGYESRLISEPVDETTTSKLKALANNGFDLILIGNMNVSMTTNMGGGMLGGEYAKTGVTSFTVKGLDPSTGRVLVRLSVEYGTAKDAGQVAKDLSQLYRDVVMGTAKPSGSTAAVPAATNQNNSNKDNATKTGTPVTPSKRGAQNSTVSATSGLVGSSVPPATVIPRAPGLNSPGGSADPGPVLSTLTPTMSWNAIGGATGYGVYVRDLTSNVVVFSSVIGNATSMVLPPGKLAAGHKYRWNVRAKNNAGFGRYSVYLFFQT